MTNRRFLAFACAVWFGGPVLAYAAYEVDPGSGDFPGLLPLLVLIAWPVTSAAFVVRGVRRGVQVLARKSHHRSTDTSGTHDV